MKLLALLQLLLAGAEDDACFLQWNASHSGGLHKQMRGVVLEANELSTRTTPHDGSMYATLAAISGWLHKRSSRACEGMAISATTLNIVDVLWMVPFFLGTEGLPAFFGSQLASRDASSLSGRSRRGKHLTLKVLDCKA